MRFVLLSLALLAGCGETAVRYTVPETTAEGTIRIGYSTVELRDISLPTYAAADEIYVKRPSGGVVSSSAVLWADTPARQISLSLARHLSLMTRATVANEPWPFDGFPSVRLEIRVEEMLAAADGTFKMSGQYFVAPESGERNRALRFDLAETFNPEGGPTEIAAARSRAVLALATQIARQGLR